MNPITADGGVVELTREEGRRMLDERTRRDLGLTLEEFERKYDAGTLDLSRSDVIGLVMLLPFARLQVLHPRQAPAGLLGNPVTRKAEVQRLVLMDGNADAW